MIISFQGVGHYTNGINNQDFGIETPKMLLILDGCSDCRFSELAHVYSHNFFKEGGLRQRRIVRKNAKEVFEELLETMKPFYSDVEDFIMSNLLFTIVACFELEDKFVVKYFGDGYILTQNKADCLSYIRLYYGKMPPYLAYKYCNSYAESYGKFEFKTMEFDKKFFKNVGIGSDGIAPFAKRMVTDADEYWFSNNLNAIKAVINYSRNEFFDDVTAAYFGGEDNGINKKLINEIIPKKDEYFYQPKASSKDDAKKHLSEEHKESHVGEKNYSDLIPYSEIVKANEKTSAGKITIPLSDDELKHVNAKDSTSGIFKKPITPIKKTIHTKLTIILLEKTTENVKMLSEFLPKMVKEGDVVFITYGDKIDVTNVGKASEININKLFEEEVLNANCRLYDAVNCIKNVLEKYRFKVFENDKEKIFYNSFEILGIGRCFEKGSTTNYDEAIKNFESVCEDNKVVTKYFCFTDKEVINAAKIGFRSIGALSTDY